MELRLPVQSSSFHHEVGESQGLLLCLSPLLKGGRTPLAESTRLMPLFSDVHRPCGKASCCPAKQLKLSCKIISERESWLNTENEAASDYKLWLHARKRLGIKGKMQ